jgi:hypothetical protein
MLTFFACIALLSASTCVNGLTFSHTHTCATHPSRDIHQFPNKTWVENLAIRHNGQILVTVLSAPELYQVDPFRTDSPPILIHRIPGVMGLLGIVELQHDVFYVIAGNWSVVTLSTTNGSYSVWKVEMGSGKVLDGATDPPAIVSKVVDIPEGVFLNGMAVLNESRGLVVIGDAGAGQVFTLDVETGKYSKTIDDPTMKPTPALQLGINGLKIRDGFLYYTSSAQAAFNRIPINGTDGSPAGPAEAVARFILGDDFSFDPAGNAYISQDPLNMVSKVTLGGVVSIVAGSLDLTQVAGATATGFGRTPNDRSVLYVTTSGGYLGPVIMQGGKVVAIYT